MYVINLQRNTFALFVNDPVYFTTGMPHECRTSPTRVLHERHKCYTSATRTTRVRNE